MVTALNAFMLADGRTSILSTELRKQSVNVRASVKRNRETYKATGQISRGRSPASVFSTQLNNTPNGEYRK